jgi:hypothetical protein
VSLGTIARVLNQALFIGIGLVVLTILLIVTLFSVARRQGRRRAMQLRSRQVTSPGGWNLSAGRVPIVAPVPETVEALSRDRATGTLRVTSGDQSASLYFVFGQLFHAEKGDLEGEDVLREVLTWREVTSTLDRRSVLPAKETIRKSA